MTKPGTSDNPLRVAIIGSGPSGFYAADGLLKQKELNVEIDMFDRLPTPHGLVRGGVAPDHPKIKSVTKVYDRIAANPNFRFYGNVDFGTDVTHEDLAQFYHAIIYAVGAQTDRNLNIPGEDLPGSHAATEFVAWYNGHPDYTDFEFDLTQEAAVVVGIGNVAMDVARILARSHDELFQTDIADYALEALKQSNVKTIYVLGRRGPAQAAFTNPEIKELGEMEEAEVIVDPSELDLDEFSQAYLDEGSDKTAIRNVEILQSYAERELDVNKPKRIIFRFLTSPMEVIGTDRVEAVKICKNVLYDAGGGRLRPKHTDDTEVIPAGLIFRSVGYRGVPLPDVPFRTDWGTIPNVEGRIHQWQDGEMGEIVPGEYAVGWIKRGPSGIIGTNKPDAHETVNQLMVDLENDRLIKPETPNRDAMETLLNNRNIFFVTYEDWLKLDELEIKRGEEIGRPRLKFTDVDDMLMAVREMKGTPAGGV